MFALKTITRGIKSSANFVEVGLIGVDFAIDNINLVQLEKTVNQEINLKACCTIQYPDSRDQLLNSPKQLKPILRHAMKEHGIRGKDIVTSMPSSDVRILSVHYTKSKNQSDAEAILNALRERIDDDVSKYVVDYLPIRSTEKEGEQLALVALVQQHLVISYLELLRYSGLNIEALEIRPAAIKRLIYSMYQKDEYKNILIINFGNEKSYITITSGRRLLFDQSIKFGADLVIEKIASLLEMKETETLELIEKHGFMPEQSKSSAQFAYSDEGITKTLLDIARPIFDEVIDEINRILIFAASENHGESIDKIYILGSLAHWNGVDDYLNKKLNLSVKALQNPLSSFVDINKNQIIEAQQAPNMAIAAGLALRGLVEYE